MLMTIEDVFREMGLLARRQIAGEISAAEADEALSDLFARAGAEMTNEQLLQVREAALRMHHVFAKSLSEQHGYSVPGNDPNQPN